MNDWKALTIHPMAQSGDIEVPTQMNDLFSYAPHALCQAMPHIDELILGEKEGKMFGVLVV